MPRITKPGLSLSLRSPFCRRMPIKSAFVFRCPILPAHSIMFWNALQYTVWTWLKLNLVLFPAAILNTIFIWIFPEISILRTPWTWFVRCTMNYLGFPFWETIARLDQTILKGQATKKVILKFSLTVSKSRNLGIVQASTLFILKDNGLSAVSFLKNTANIW